MESVRGPRFHPDLRGFFDYTRVSEWNFATKTLTAMAAQRKLSATGKAATLVKGVLACGLIRVYQAHGDSGEVMVFTERTEAPACLDEGVPPEVKTTPGLPTERPLPGSKPGSFKKDGHEGSPKNGIHSLGGESTRREKCLRAT